MQRAAIAAARVVCNIERLQEQASRLSASVTLLLDPQPKLVKTYIDIAKSKLGSSGGLLHNASQKGRCAGPPTFASRVQLLCLQMSPRCRLQSLNCSPTDIDKLQA